MFKVHASIKVQFTIALILMLRPARIYIRTVGHNPELITDICLVCSVYLYSYFLETRTNNIYNTHIMRYVSMSRTCIPASVMDAMITQFT